MQAHDLNIANLDTTTAMSAEEAAGFFHASGRLRFAKDTSYAASMLVSALRGGKKADPDNLPTAYRLMEDLERRFEAIVVHHNLAPAPEPATPRAMPPLGDLPALLSSAGSDARWIKQQTYGGGGMSMGCNIAEAHRVMRGLRPKMVAAYAIWETLPKPERISMDTAERTEFWRKLEDDLLSGRAVDR